MCDITSSTVSKRSVPGEIRRKEAVSPPPGLVSTSLLKKEWSGNNHGESAVDRSAVNINNPDKMKLNELISILLF